jgi:predicted dehydrogenase
MLRAAAIKLLPSYRLAVVSDINQDRARIVAARYGGDVELDWRKLIHREELDMVVVSTPPHLHAEICIAALNAGKHVLCEKPLARTPVECREIVEAAADNGRLLATGFNYRFYPSMQKARTLLDSGVIGELDHIRSYTGYSATEHSQPWLHDVEIMGGGALRDNGIHLIDLTCYFLGEVEEVMGFASDSVWRFKGCEDNGFVLLRNKNGKIASLHASWTEWRGYRLCVEIYGSLGCIRAWCFPMMTQVVWSQQRGGPIRRKTHFFPITFIQEHLRSYRWIVTQSFVLEFQALLKAIRNEPTPLASGRDGLRAVEIAHAACSTFINGFSDFSCGTN